MSIVRLPAMAAGEKLTVVAAGHLVRAIAAATALCEVDLSGPQALRARTPPPFARARAPTHPPSHAPTHASARVDIGARTQGAALARTSCALSRPRSSRSR